MTILLVDDEQACRMATAMLLQHLGYSVESVASAEDALAVFNPVEHQLVITDFLMSGMSGDDLARELRRQAPAIPIIMYSASPGVNSERVDALVAKPASIADFRSALKKVGSPEPSAGIARARKEAGRLRQAPDAAEDQLRSAAD